jgi:uncharacterized membrane protein
MQGRDFVRAASAPAFGLGRALAWIMASKHPVHQLLIALPLAAFALTIAALAGHAKTGDDAWYRGALIADLGGLVVALLATFEGLGDAITMPRFTVERAASLRHAGVSLLGVILFAATATTIFNRYQGRAVGDVLPLVLAGAGFIAIACAAWYGRVVLHALQVRYTTVWYPAHMMSPLPARRRPGSARTLV